MATDKLTVTLRKPGDPVVIAWWLFVALAVVIFIKLIPGSLKAAELESDFSATDAAAMNASLSRVHLTLPDMSYIQWGISTVLQIIGMVIAWLMVQSRDRNRFTIATAFVIVALTTATYPPGIPDLLPGQPVWQALTLAVTMTAVIGFFTLPLIFPTGRFAGRWVIPTIVLILAGNIGLGRFPFDPNSMIGELFDVFFALVLVGTIVASLLINYRKAESDKERQQFKWVSLGMIIAIPLFFIGDFMMRHTGPGASGLFCLVGFTLIMPFAFFLPALAIGIAILRYRLFDIDLLLSQTLIWIALTLSVTGTYIAIVLGIGTLLNFQNSLVLSLAATGLVAVAFQPVSTRIQLRIRRWVYGRRDEPYTALAKLGHRIEAALTIDDILPAIVRTTVEALSLPYAALYLETPNGPLLTATAGSPTTFALNLPLTNSGERIGTLAIGERGPGYVFSQQDRKLLEDLARQVGVAAHTVRLTADLQKSRERIVITREDERRRLRRDLHDGLGAHLAGLLMLTSSLRTAIRQDPTAAEAELDILRTELRQAIADVRRLVAGLRPPSLDELGLVGALQERLQRFGRGGIDAGSSPLDIIVTTSLGEMQPGAAAEVALYRIAEEAMTNVVRHAQATSATVSLNALPQAIELRITDNGQGIDPNQPRGVGLTSMHERAAELGGTLTIESGPNGIGTMIVARIPVGEKTRYT